VLLTDGPADLSDDDRGRLAAADVSVDERVVAELLADDGELTAIAFADGSRFERRGLLVAATLHQRTSLAEKLGADQGPATPISADPLDLDALSRTTADGVFAAGDLSAGMPQVAAAVAAGSFAATAVVGSLFGDDFGLATPEWRSRVNA
jgi:thioredoxin reductase